MLNVISRALRAEQDGKHRFLLFVVQTVSQQKQPMRSFMFCMLSLSLCDALTLSYRPYRHLTQILFWLQLTWRDTLMCVLSARLLLTFCAAFVWERPNNNLQKHTVVNCQSWSPSCYPPLCIKKPRLSLWCAGTSVLLGVMPPAFLCIHPLSVQLTSVKSLHKWMLSGLHEMVLSLKKNTQHSKLTTAKHRSDVDVGVLETTENPDVSFMACTAAPAWSLSNFNFCFSSSQNFFSEDVHTHACPCTHSALC